MTFYDYKVIPAPKQLKRVKGVRSGAELLSVTLADAINAVAREGWEYVRAEVLTAQEEGGFLRRGVEVVETVLVFRRPRESLGPRRATHGPAAASPPRSPTESDAPERPAPDRGIATPLRREPRLSDGPDTGAPLRPAPRLGPAD